MKNTAKIKQIVVRFDHHSYEKIKEYAEMEHRGFGDFVRHATLYYVEHQERAKTANIVKRRVDYERTSDLSI